MESNLVVPSPVMKWYEIWQEVWKKPGSATFEKILQEPAANISNAYKYVAWAGVLSGLVSLISTTTIGTLFMPLIVALILFGCFTLVLPALSH
jgi:hypothetical protein